MPTKKFYFYIAFNYKIQLFRFALKRYFLPYHLHVFYLVFCSLLSTHRTAATFVVAMTALNLIRTEGRAVPQKPVTPPVPRTSLVSVVDVFARAAFKVPNVTRTLMNVRPPPTCMVAPTVAGIPTALTNASAQPDIRRCPIRGHV